MKIKRILSMVLALVLSIGAMSITAFAAEETMYGIGFVNASSLQAPQRTRRKFRNPCLCPPQ